MSTSADHMRGLSANAAAERRFYPRVTPSVPTYIAFGPNNLATLENVSENGLLVSTPNALDLNSVHRVFLSLDRAPDIITVHVRTVWTAESKKLSGIQLLDLSEDDRKQIREWAALQISRNETQEPWFSPTSPETSSATEASTEPISPTEESSEDLESPEKPPPTTASVPPPEPLYSPVKAWPMPRPQNEDFPDARAAVVRRTNSQSSKSLLIGWTALMVAVCVGAGWHFRHDLSGKFLHRPAQPARQNAPATNPALPAEDQTSALTPANDPGNMAAHLASGRIESGNPPSEDIPPKTNANAAAVPSAPASTRARKDTASNLASGKRFGSKPLAPKPSFYQSPTRPSPTAPRDDFHSDIADSAPHPATHNDATSVPTREPDPTPLPMPTTPSRSVAATASIPPAPAPPAASAPNPTQIQPSANSPSAGASLARVVPADAPPHKSAITGSIANSARPSDLYAASSSASRSTSSTPPVHPPSSAAASRSNTYIARNSFAPRSAPLQPAVIQMDTPQPRVIDVTPPKSFTTSFVNLPGEKIFGSATVTMHVQRSVRVRGGDRWLWPAERLLWRGHKKVELGELASRVDPQTPQAPVTPGSITVEATIDKDGYVNDVRPLYGSFALLPSVARAIRGWRYLPTYLDNKPAETQAKIEINFHPPAASRRSL